MKEADIKFEFKKKFKTTDGEIITMKRLIHFNFPQLKEKRVECFENKRQYLSSEIEEIIEEPLEEPPSWLQQRLYDL